MSSLNYRDREIRYYQDRLAQLEQQNQTLKSHHCFQHQQTVHYVDPLANSIIELNAQNQRLEREAELYQKQIKRQLTEFIRESNLMKQCNFRRKYINALSYPPPKISVLRR